MSRTIPAFALLTALVGCDTYLTPMEQDREHKLALEAASEATTPSGTCATADRCADDLGFVDVYVSEVMADPSACTDATGEWIEVYNDTDGTVDLNGALVEDRGTGARGVVKGLPVLQPGQYAVLGRGSAETFCGPTPDGFYGSAVNLNNSGDGLYLLRPSDNGSIDYVISWPEVLSGVSFETSTLDWWHWLYAVQDMGDGELGTPGSGPHDPGFVRPLAQVEEGVIDITEVMGNPTCAYDTCEWVELYNSRGVAIDLTGLGLVDAAGNTGAFDGVVLQPYGRAVFGRYDADSFGDATIPVAGYYGNVGLNNSNEQLFLVDGDRVLFASPVFPTFESGASWHYTGWTDDDLASWEQGEATPGL